MTYYIIDTHGLVWFLEESPKLGEMAREAFLDEDSNLIIPTIVLAEIKFLFDKNRFSTSLDRVFSIITDDPRCIVQSLDLDVISLLPTTLEIHDAIIAATGLLFKERQSSEDVVVITKDEEITKSKLVKTIW
ncbi:PIN domain-containing protein [candidate division WOR-3 bacterium]|nr:PIN domain-containing protein [candidate division WOR-3 bacterium]